MSNWLSVAVVVLGYVYVIKSGHCIVSVYKYTICDLEQNSHNEYLIGSIACNLKGTFLQFSKPKRKNEHSNMSPKPTVSMSRGRGSFRIVAINSGCGEHVCLASLATYWNVAKDRSSNAVKKHNNKKASDQWVLASSQQWVSRAARRPCPKLISFIWGWSRRSEWPLLTGHCSSSSTMLLVWLPHNKGLLQTTVSVLDF